MKQIPKSITLLGKKIKIHYEPMETNLGLSNFSEMAIYINSKQSIEEAKNTLLHECMHMILYIAGVSFMFDENLEEAIVRALEHGLVDIVKFK